jgi:hypothetical protein
MGNFGGSAYAVMAIPSKMGDVAEVNPPKKAYRLCCVLVHGVGSLPPPRLNRALETKKVEVQPTPDIYGALAELCRLAKDESVALPILAIVEPESVAHAASLFEAAAVYAPNAVLWVYASAPHEQIREVRESDIERWRGVSGTSADTGAAEQGRGLPRTGSGIVEPAPPDRPSADLGDAEAGPPPLRLTGSPGGEPAGRDDASPVEAGGSASEQDGGPGDAESGSVLTDEELEMLLADELPENDFDNGDER